MTKTKLFLLNLLAAPIFFALVAFLHLPAWSVLINAAALAALLGYWPIRSAPHPTFSSDAWPMVSIMLVQALGAAAGCLLLTLYLVLSVKSNEWALVASVGIFVTAIYGLCAAGGTSVVLMVDIIASLFAPRNKNDK